MLALLVSRMETVQEEEIGNRSCVLGSLAQRAGAATGSLRCD